MHLLKVVFGVESACEIKYTPSSIVSVKKKHTVNKKLTICLMDKTVRYVSKNTMCIYR